MQDSCITPIERKGFSAKYNFADGHCTIDSTKYFGKQILNLSDIWIAAEETPVQEMERMFCDTFANTFNLQGLKESPYYSICPTASNSIDIVGAWLSANNKVVGLLEPTFDNLALLLMRRNVNLVPVSEEDFYDFSSLEIFIKKNKIDCLFFVNPNNPTGNYLEEKRIIKLSEFANKFNITIIMDMSFRFCLKNNVDEYRIFKNNSNSFIILEDTGKMLPAIDSKASILCCDEKTWPQLRQIYEELYLCSSNFTLNILNNFLLSLEKKGGLPFIHQIISKRRKLVERYLAETILKPNIVNISAEMSVMWINCSETGLNDLEFSKYLFERNIAILPGRYFFWSSYKYNGHSMIRLALLKSDDYFLDGVKMISKHVKKLSLDMSKVCL